MAPCPALIILLPILLALHASCHDVSPTITARARLPRGIQARQAFGFAGFLSVDGGEFSPTYCNPGSTWSTSSSYCGCMPTTSVGFSIASSCLGGSVLENPGQFTCPSEEPFCYTMSYFQDVSDTAPLRGYGCYIEDTTLMIYKRTPSAAATATTASSSAANSFFFSSSSTSFPSTGTSQPSTASSKPKSSAWIAGPVIGAFAGGAILVGVAFWIWSLHRRLAQTQRDIRATEIGPEKPPQSQELSQAMPAASAPQSQELDSHRVMEALGHEIRTELPAR